MEMSFQSLLLICLHHLFVSSISAEQKSERRFSGPINRLNNYRAICQECLPASASAIDNHSQSFHLPDYTIILQLV